LAADAGQDELLALLDAHDGEAGIVVTAIGGQGHFFGRGNQQFSPAVIRAVGLDNILVVAGKGKIRGLEGRPLLVDTNDPELDAALCGYRRVLTGYHDEIYYPVALVP
jgi:predicted polyphosphate/ATP-dependent NAD kinase